MNSSIALQVRRLSRAHATVHRQDVMTAGDLELVATLLIHHTPLNYDSYCMVRDQLPPRFSRIFTASLFARLPRGSDDVVSPFTLLRYLRESMVLRYVYRCLAMYDSVGDGYLREHDLENYIFEAIPGSPELAALQDNFYPFYVFTAVRNLFFFLDHNRQGKIKLRELVGSRAFAEWLKVLPPGHPFLGPAGEALMPNSRRGAGGGGGDNGGSSEPPSPRASLASSGNSNSNSNSVVGLIAHSTLNGNNSSNSNSSGSSNGAGNGSSGSNNNSSSNNSSSSGSTTVLSGTNGGSSQKGNALPSPRSPYHTLTVEELLSAMDMPIGGSSTGSPGSSPSSSPSPTSSSSSSSATAGGGGNAPSPPPLLPPSPPQPPPTASPLNWFSASNALRVYSAYLQLDKDENGMLSPQELAGYQGRMYTPAFVHRLFSECRTYGSAAGGEEEEEEGFSGGGGGGGGQEIDYKTYLEVVLASENRHTPPSLRFFFKLLDVEHQGWFGAGEVHYFYSQVQMRLAALGYDTVDAGNVGDEIFDMVSPATPGRITYEDLRRSKMGGVVCGILLDAQAFIAHDRREEFRGEEVEASGEGEEEGLA